MQSISRQVQKKRKGITVPINEHKRQRFIQNLYLDAELKKLDTLLDENDVNFDDLISKDEQEQLNDSYYLVYLKNQYSLSGRPFPYNITITVKIGHKDVVSIIEEVLDCFRLPLTISIDFWAVLTSISRPKGDILFPSRATACNKTSRIRSTKDIERLLDEFKVLPVEKIIQRHFVNESSSGLNMRNLLALELYITKHPFR